MFCRQIERKKCSQITFPSSQVYLTCQSKVTRRTNRPIRSRYDRPVIIVIGVWAHGKPYPSDHHYQHPDRRFQITLVLCQSCFSLAVTEFVTFAENCPPKFYSDVRVTRYICLCNLIWFLRPSPDNISSRWKRDFNGVVFIFQLLE